MLQFIMIYCGVPFDLLYILTKDVTDAEANQQYLNVFLIIALSFCLSLSLFLFPPPVLSCPTSLDSQDSGSLCFCFRWLLIWFKREFSFEDILTLWEVMELCI